MPTTRPTKMKSRAVFFGAACGVALSSVAIGASAQTREPNFLSHLFGNPANRGSHSDNYARPPAQHRQQPRIKTLALNPDEAPIDMAKPDRPRPKGSDARVCANQEKDLATYRIQSCTVIINSGRLKEEALGVAYELRGLAHLDRSDVPHAIGDLNRAIDLAPEFAPAYQNRGNAWYARGNYGQALADYDKAIALDPNSASPYLNRAAVRRDLGYREGALEDYARAIELRPNHAASYSGRGQLYLAQKDYARATTDFDRAVQYDPGADNYMLRAAAREGAGDLDGALRNFHEAAKLDPKNVAPLNAMAAALYQNKDYDKEIAVLDRAIPLDKKPALSYRLRAEAWRAKGDRKKAYADVGHALQYAWSVNGLRIRGNMKLEDGDTDGALKDAESILKIESDNVDGFALRGLAYARKKDYAKALPDLNKAVAADAGNALAYAARGQAYLAEKDSARALPDLSRAIDLKIASAAPYRARAAIYGSKGDTDKAIADLNQAIALDPHPAEPWLERAALRKAKGDMPGAIADYDAALKRDPNNARSYYLRGQAREQGGDADKAIADFKLALARDAKLNEARAAIAAVEQRRESARLAEESKAKLAKAGALDKTPAGKSRKTKVAVATPLPEARPAPSAEAAPEVTGAIPPPGANPEPQIRRETARERANREVRERKKAEREAREAAHRAHETRARTHLSKIIQVPPKHVAHAPPRELTPSEKRRLYFQALEQRQRAEQSHSRRAGNFNDVFR